MPTRREFLKTAGIAAAGLSAGISFPAIARPQNDYTSRRPPISERNFTSESVENIIKKVSAELPDKELAWMFENCYPNTLDTTVQYKEINGMPDTFVITGDIHAMWLRDSSAQVWPYLPLTKEDEKLRKLIAGVINQQTKCILIDPYANAFNEGPTGSEWDKDLTDMKPELHERKWEIDSLCYPVRLAYNYWKETGDTSVFDKDWQKAMKLVLKTFKQQQRKDGRGPYRFQRLTEVQTDTVALSGYGNPVKPVGLICSIFRPSDDATIFSFLVPSNYFAVLSLRQIAEIFETVIGENQFAGECRKLADEVETALKNYANVNHLTYGNMLAYEVDGFGNMLFMDDANIPSLLAMPYLQTLDKNDPLYKASRKFVLSDDNPYFFKGTAAEGIGGPHVGMGMIWPMSIIMRAMTSSDRDEIKYCVQMLKETHAGTGFMHESFNKDNPKDFTRKWFAWANTLFGELILKIYNEDKDLLKQL